MTTVHVGAGAAVGVNGKHHTGNPRALWAEARNVKIRTLTRLDFPYRMAEMKTKLTGMSPTAFIGTVDERRRADCRELIALMRAATGQPPKMWGSIVGFDTYRLKYANGREIDFMLTGFAPRKQDLVLYLGPGLEHKDLLAKLGKHKAKGGVCTSSGSTTSIARCSGR